MMNVELKPITDDTNIEGNIAYIKVTLKGFNDDDNITFTRNVHNEHNIETIMANVSEEDVFIPTEPKPKYDPNRRFRKGDLVTLVDHYRGDAYRKFIGHEFEVKQDEAADGQVTVANALNTKLEMTSIYFQLVKSIEEIEEEEREKARYYVQYNEFNSCASVADRKSGIMINSFRFLEYGEEEACKLAQCCCDILNAKHGGKND